MRRSKDNKRVQFEFSKVALERLDELVDVTDASSRAEVVRTALRVYDYIIEQSTKGYTMGFEKDGEIFKVLPLPT